MYRIYMFKLNEWQLCHRLGFKSSATLAIDLNQTAALPQVALCDRTIGESPSRAKSPSGYSGILIMIRIIRCALAALMLGGAAVAALAADLPRVVPAPAPVLSDAFQPWQVRLRAVGVLPEGGGILQNSANGGFVSGGVKASDAVIPELDVSYFFTKNIAVEAICCVSYHNLFLQGGSLNGTYIGRTLLFPPTVLLQYHVTTLGAFQPYAGVGVNYTHYFGIHPDGSVLNSLSVRDSWGVAGQIGFDYMIDDHWGFNFDVKKILMNPRVNATVAPGVASVSGNAALSPWMIGAGITYRFGGPATGIVAKY